MIVDILTQNLFEKNIQHLCQSSKLIDRNENTLDIGMTN